MVNLLILSMIVTTTVVMMVLLMRTLSQVRVSKKAVAVEPVPHLDWVRPMGFPFTAGLLIKFLLLLEGPLDLVPLFLWEIILLTLFGTLVVWSQLQRLFSLRINVETKDCTTIVGITWLQQLPFWSSLVRQRIFVQRTQMGNSTTNTKTFNLSMWETRISFSFSRNTWKCLICLTPFSFLSGLNRMLLVYWTFGGIGRKMQLIWQSTGLRFAQARVCLGEWCYWLVHR